jgi:hypothetical protein
MNTQRYLRDLANAMHDHRFVTVALTNGQSAKGRITNISETGFVIGAHPQIRNRFSFDRVESVKIY